MAEASKDAIIQLVTSDWEAARQFDERFKQNLKKLYDLYRCIYRGKPLPTRNKIMLPLLLSAVWSDVAFTIQTLLGSVFPFIEFRTEDPLQVLPNKRTDAVVNQQLRESDIFTKMIDLLVTAQVYGTGITRLSWRAEKYMHKYRHELMPGLMISVSDEMTIFDGPDIENVDPLDFAVMPGYKTIDASPRVYHRFYTDVDDLISLNVGPNPMFDPAAIQELVNSPMPGPAVGEYLERTNVWRSMSDFEARRQQKYAKPVEIIELWGLVPSEFAPDGYRQRVITIANRKVVLRNDCTPFWSKRLVKPFRSYSPMPDHHSFWGIGKGEIVSKTAGMANTLVSARVDAIQQFLAPAFIASDQAGLDGQNLVLWPGRVVKSRAPDVSDTHIRPISPDLRGYQLVFDEIAALTRYIQQATGVAEDTIQGFMTGARTTAREFLARQEMGKNRLSLEVLLFERLLCDVAECYRDMDRQLLTFPRIINRLGVSAVIDKDTGMPIPPDPELMSVNDLNIDAKAYAVGSTQMLGKQMQVQNLTMGGQFAAAIPQVALTTNWNAFMSRYWRALDVNPEELIATKIPEANLIAGMLGAGGGGGAQSASGSGGGTGLEGLDTSRLQIQPSSNVMPMS